MKERHLVLPLSALLLNVFIASYGYSDQSKPSSTSRSFYQSVCGADSRLSTASRLERQKNFQQRNAPQAAAALEDLERNVVPSAGETIRALLKKAIFHNPVPGLFRPENTNALITRIDSVKIYTSQDIPIAATDILSDTKTQYYADYCVEGWQANAFFLSNQFDQTNANFIIACPGNLTMSLGSGNREESNIRNLIFFYAHEFGHHLLEWADRKVFFKHLDVKEKQQDEILADAWAAAASYEYQLEINSDERRESLAEIMSPICAFTEWGNYLSSTRRFELFLGAVPEFAQHIEGQDNQSISERQPPNDH